MWSVTKRFDFAASHYLPSYDGICNRVHGHTYILDVTVAGDPKEEGPKKGMILDFSVLKKIVEEKILSKLDHRDLNLIFDHPTAELMVKWIFDELDKEIKRLFPEGVTFYCLELVNVRLWETPDKAYAEFGRRL